MKTFSETELQSIVKMATYRVQPGDTLSTIAEALQYPFPSLSRSTRFDIEDEIYRTNASAFINRDKNLIKSYAVLDLKFILEFRNRNFCLPILGNSYVFTAEDQFAYNCDRIRFWDVFRHCNNVVGMYLQESVEAQKLSELPKEISLNLNLPRGTVNSRLIHVLKQKIQKSIVSLSEISEYLLEILGFPYSSIEVSDLIEKLSRENSLCQCRHENCVYIPASQLEYLSTNYITELYQRTSLASYDLNTILSGFYILKEQDLLFSSDIFWQRILPDFKDRELTFNFRKHFRYSDDISHLKAGTSIFVATMQGLNEIYHNNHNAIDCLCRISDTLFMHHDVVKTNIELAILHEQYEERRKIDFFENSIDDLVQIETLLKADGFVSDSDAVNDGKTLLSFIGSFSNNNRMKDAISKQITNTRTVLTQRRVRKIQEKAFDEVTNIMSVTNTNSRQTSSRFELPKHGFYFLTDSDKKFINRHGSNRFLEKLFKDDRRSFELTQKAREAAGLPRMELSQDEIFQGKIFMVVESAVNELSRYANWYDVDLKKKSGRFKVPHEALERLSIIKLYAQYQEGKEINQFPIITSTNRPAKKQAELMVDYFEETLLKGEKISRYGYLLDEYLKIRYGVSWNKIHSSAERERVIREFTLEVEAKNRRENIFPHLRTDICVADISATRGLGSYSSFVDAVGVFRKVGKFITPYSTNDNLPDTLLLGERQEPCHHIVFTGLTLTSEEI